MTNGLQSGLISLKRLFAFLPGQLPDKGGLILYTDPFSGENYEVDADVLELAKQVNVVGYQALQRGFSHYGAIQRFPAVNLPGTTLGTFALNDSAIMLIEIKGQTQNIGQKQSGMLTQTAVVSIYDILMALADGTIHDVDASLYEEILPSANPMRDPTR